MKRNSFIFLLLLALFVLLIIVFNRIQTEKILTRSDQSVVMKNNVNIIGEIPMPEGFERIDLIKDSFGLWLRQIKLKRDNTVRLYNGIPVARQDLHYAVLDVSTGSKDLQHCADAIMRLKAEYYFSRKEYNKISFMMGNGTRLNFASYAIDHSNCFSHDCLLNFLERVFINCGTYTVDEMTRQVKIDDIEPGDVFVKAGSPGHAMIVVDVATNKTTGEKIYLLAQSYMPAQDMHIVINPNDQNLSPWYKVSDVEKIVTPGWVFDVAQLKTWK